jgi:glycosyltransferase involved in cell wall biosynthesis
MEKNNRKYFQRVSKMKLSIIIPVYNEEKDIAECLKSLNEQTFKNFEIIIVDDGSTDRTIEIAKRFNVKIIKGMHKGPGYSRNIGAKNAKGEVLIFIDADMTFEKDYLKNLIKPLENKETIGTTHELEIVKNTENIWSRCWGKIRVSKEEAKNIKIFRAIRKDKFLELGGFNPKYGYADDQTFWFDYNIKPVVAIEAVCYHKNPENLKAVYKQSRWIGASIDNFIVNIPLVKYLVPLAMILLSPIAILVYSIKRCYRNRNFLLFPAMLVFMIARYFGTISGLFRKIFLNKNIK